MEKTQILFCALWFLLFIVALLSWMLRITSKERNDNEEYIWKLSKENSDLIDEIHKIKTKK